MATTVYAFSDNDVALRYREPYISAGLNSKYQGAVPVGVYEGFVPVPAVSNRTLYLQPGSSGYGVALATSSLDASYQVSVQIPGGQILDLNAYAGKTVDIGIEASYSFPSVTSAVIKAYDLSIETPPAYATMLCRVVVPSGATTIPSANISLTGRTFAWQTQSRDGISFLSVVKNGNFSFGVAGSAPDYWETVAGVGTLLVAATTPPSGYGNVIVGTAANTSAQTSTLRQYIGLPVTNNRGRLRVSLYYQQLSAPATSNPVVNVVFKRPDANNVQTTRTLALTTTGTATLTEDLAYVYTMSPRGAYLEYIEISFNSATYASSGAKFNISDVVVAIESDSGATDIGPELTGTHRTTRLQVIDPQDQSASGSETSVTYDSATGRTVFSTGITVSGSAVVSSTVTAGTSVLTPTVDTATAVALNIGTSTQTALTVGRVAAVTTVDGSNVNIGSNSASTTSVLVGSSAASNASVTVGSAPIGGTTSTAISANSINVGTSQYTTAINIGTASPATFRNIAVGADSAATTVAVTASTLTVGGVNTSNLSLGATTAGTATVTLGNASGAGTVTTSVQGHTLNIGTAANTTAVTIGDGATGTVRVNRYFDGNSGILSLGTDTTRTTSVEISRTGQTTTVQGNLVVTGTATFTSGVTASSVDSATVGGSVSVGGTNAGTISLGNAANTTVINIGSTVVGSAAIVLGNSAGTTTTSVLGKTVTLGDSSTTTVNIGASTAGAGTNTTRLRGDTIVIGDEANTDSVTLGDGASGTLRVNGYLDGNGSALGIGTDITQTATALTLGHTSSLTTSLVGTTVNLTGTTVTAGNAASNTTISIGTTAPTSARTITLGANSATQTTIINGGPITIGGSATTTANIVNNATSTVQIARYAPGNVFLGSGDGTTGPALVQVGGTTAGNIINTALQGDTITLGTDANTNSLTIGNGVSGTVRVARYLDGNAGLLDIGTDTIQTTTSVTLGRSGIPVYVRGSTVYLDPVGGVATLDAAPNASTIYLGYNCTNTNIATNAASGIIQIGTYGANTLDTRIYGQEIYADSPSTSKILLGNNTSGQMRVHGYLDGNFGGLSLGTNATATSGNISIAHGAIATTVNSPLYLANSTFDRATAGTLDIGTANATTITQGQAGQLVSFPGDVAITGNFQRYSTSGVTPSQHYVPEPDYFATSKNMAGTTITTGVATRAIFTSLTFAGLGITYNTTSNYFLVDAGGVYEVDLSLTGVTINTTGVVISFRIGIDNHTAGNNLVTQYGFNDVAIYTRNGATITNGEYVNLRLRSLFTFATPAFGGDFFVYYNATGGTSIEVAGDLEITVRRVKRFYTDT